MMPFFSVVMQSTLKDYPGAATNREEKLLRAVDSVLKQYCDDLELIVIADGCDDTIRLLEGYTDERLLTHKIEIEQPKNVRGKWRSVARNVGIRLANGRYIVYLDNDDMFTPHYLRYLKDEILRDTLAWYVVDHYYKVPSRWKYKRVELRPNSAGTANIVHTKRIRSRWPEYWNYGAEDWAFIRSIINERIPHRHIDLAGYMICHMRGVYDV